MDKQQVPDYQQIVAAADRISGEAIRTPLIENSQLNKITGANIFLKAESLQRTGSFKFRGAYNAISLLDKKTAGDQIVASSSGNHAQGVAEAARILGYKATIVMPDDAPATKLERTQRSGADVVFFDRAKGERDRVADETLQRLGGSFIHPFDNVDVIAGQGTVGLEIAETLDERGLKLDRVLVCTGGGGLTAGVALAVNKWFPGAKIHSVEPEGFEDYKRSLESGCLETNAQSAGSICDAIIVPSPGKIGFEVNRHLLSEGLVVSDEEALKAVRFAFHELKLIVEPGGAVTLAALLQAGKRWQGETIAAVLSGGNMDGNILAKALS